MKRRARLTEFPGWAHIYTGTGTYIRKYGTSPGGGGGEHTFVMGGGGSMVTWKDFLGSMDIFSGL